MEFKSHAIVNHCLFKCEGLQCLFCSLPGISCTSSTITTMRKVESQFGELVCALRALLIVSRLENLANHLVKPSSSRSTYFFIQAFLYFLMIEREKARWLSSNQPGLCSFKHTLLDYLNILIFNSSEQ